jgi:hypothetical protein
MSNQKECNECKKTPYNNKQLLVVLLGSYLLVSCIYGTIQIVKDLIHLVK